MGVKFAEKTHLDIVSIVLEPKKREKIERWLKIGDANIGVSTTLRGCIRQYILDDQNGRCAICGIDNFWNGERLNFILDHIDGDATYKSRNKNSARVYRRAS